MIAGHAAGVAAAMAAKDKLGVQKVPVAALQQNCARKSKSSILSRASRRNA